jgi:hypothetical protein
MKTYEGVEVQLHHSKPQHYVEVSSQTNPRETASSAHCTEGWQGPKTSRDTMQRIKISCPARIEHQFFGYPGCSLVTILTELS